MATAKNEWHKSTETMEKKGPLDVKNLWKIWITPTCWWSLWMLFVLFEFACKREVSAIINPAKIGMILRLPETRWLEERSRIVLYPFCTSLHWFLLMRYQDLRENWRFEDPKDLIKDLEHILHVPWSKFDSLSPFSPGKVQFIS